MTKLDIAERVQANTSLSKEKAMKAVQTILNVITHELSKGNDVIYRGVGTWRILKKNGRMGRNPRTGELAWVRPRHVVSFKASQKWKEMVDSPDQ